MCGRLLVTLVEVSPASRVRYTVKDSMTLVPTKTVLGSRASMATAPHPAMGRPAVRSVQIAPWPAPALAVIYTLKSDETVQTTLGSLGATLRSAMMPRPPVTSLDIGVQLAAPSLVW